MRLCTNHCHPSVERRAVATSSSLFSSPSLYLAFEAPAERSPAVLNRLPLVPSGCLAIGMPRTKREPRYRAGSRFHRHLSLSLSLVALQLPIFLNPSLVTSYSRYNRSFSPSPLGDISYFRKLGPSFVTQDRSYRYAVIAVNSVTRIKQCEAERWTRTSFAWAAK